MCNMYIIYIIYIYYIQIVKDAAQQQQNTSHEEHSMHGGCIVLWSLKIILKDVNPHITHQQKYGSLF